MELISFQTSQPLRRGKERRQKQNKQSADLLSVGFIHDMANLCHIILGNAELLMSDVSPQDKNYKCITIINSKANKAVDLCKAFMADSMGQIGKTVVFSLEDIINEISCLKSNNSTQITFQVEKDLWNITADRKEVRLCLKNFLNNAEQAMAAAGNIFITAENVSDKENLIPGKGNYVKISVNDHGCGIPESNMNKIFMPGFTTKKNGNGMGLALCKQIIEKNNGSIQIKSSPEGGTIVSVFLPAVNSQAS